MTEDPPIVKDTRRIRSAISHEFGNSVDKYVAYLRAAPSRAKRQRTSLVKEGPTAYSTTP